MNHSQLQNRKKAKKGFSIIEVILAGSILALIVFGIVSAWLYGQHALVKSGDTGRGVAIASEGIEIMRNLRDFDFGILQDGTYALSNNGSGWILVPNDKETIGAYKRYLTIASDGISKRNITSTVEWTNVDGSPGIISSNTVLTNWQQQIRRPVKSTTLQITEVVASPAETSVTITWKTNKLASSRVQYGTTASYGSLTPVTDLSPMVLNHSVTISGLLMATTYHFRVTSVDATGAQAYSNDATFTTNADATAPVISNIVATPSETGVVITWDTNEASSSYVDYGTDDSYGTTTPEIDNVTRVTSHTVTITGLTANTLYHFRVNSTDASVNTATSSDDTFTTTATAVVISNVQIAATSVTYFTVTWTTNVPADTRIISGNDSFAPITIDTVPLVTSHEVTVSGLEPCALYNKLTIESYSTSSSDVESVADITTGGCPATVVYTQEAANIRDIEVIAVRPYESGDLASYVYALNSTGENSPELSTFTIAGSGTIDNEHNKDASELNNDGIAASAQIFALRNYLYVLSSKGSPVKVYDIGSSPDHPNYLRAFEFTLAADPQSIYIKEVTISGELATIMLIGYQEGVDIFRMTPHLDEGSPANPLNPLEDPSVWTRIGQLTFDVNKVNPKDIWVSDSFHAENVVHVLSPEYIFKTTIATGSYDHVMDRAEFNGSEYPLQLAGNNATNDLFATGAFDMRIMQVDSFDFLNLDYSAKTAAVSKTFTVGPYVFINTKDAGKDYRALSIDVDSNIATQQDVLGLSDVYDSTYYEATAGSSIGYMEYSHLIFYSKKNKILIIDPNL
ncbi:MAG: fibronectin type III domain-containing protein [Candidatus Pacebacteria bacterium]|nr:fibronectin type III domain-containing protein [Candidatus Paceibacterota bacterium]